MAETSLAQLTPLTLLSGSSQNSVQSPMKKNLTRKQVFATGDNKNYSLSVIGIANSVELFKGDIGQKNRVFENTKDNTLSPFQKKQKFVQDSKESKYFLTENEVRLLFKPYESDELIEILFTLYTQRLHDIGVY